MDKSKITRLNVYYYEVVAIFYDENLSETRIFFNPHKTGLSRDDFIQFGETITSESRGSVILLVDLVNYGVLRLIVNPKISSSEDSGINEDGAVEMLVKKIAEYTI